MKNTRTRNTIYNIIASMGIKLLTILLQMVSRIVFVQVLAVEYLGINGLFANILSLLSLADLGMNTAMTYSLYQPLAENNTVKITQLISFFKKIYSGIAFAVSSVGIMLVPFIKYIVNLEEPLEYLEVYYLLFLMNSVFSYLCVYKTTLLVADQKEYLFGKVRAIYQIVNFVAINLCLLVFKNYILYLLIGNICRLIENIIENRLVTKKYSYLNNSELPLDKDEKRKIFDNVKSLFLYKFSSIIQGNTDSILISVMIGTITVGYYSNYLLIINGIVVLITTIFSAFKSGIGNLLASETSNEHKYILFKSLGLLSSWLTLFCGMTLLVTFNDLISLMFGGDYIINIEIVVVIIINFYTSNVRQAIWAYRETTGIFSQTKFITLVTAILNLVFSITLGIYIGLFGIVLATIIARLLYAWWREPQILFWHCFKRSPSEYYKKYIFNFLFFIVNSIVIYSVCDLIIIDNLVINLIVKVCICICGYNVVYALVYWKTEEFRFLLNKLQQIVQKNFD